MFFTRLGQVVAFLALALGVFNIVVGFMTAAGNMGPPDEALMRYFPGRTTTGEVIDRGMYLVVFSIGLGILTEIRRALK